LHKKSEQAIYEQAARSIESNNKDFPFGIIYKISETENSKAAAFIGFRNDQSVFPHILILKIRLKALTIFTRLIKPGNCCIRKCWPKKKITKGRLAKRSDSICSCTDIHCGA
jgi:hypothetical protein